jgi:hypothetical protein
MPAAAEIFFNSTDGRIIPEPWRQGRVNVYSSKPSIFCFRDEISTDGKCKAIGFKLHVKTDSASSLSHTTAP